MDQYTHDTKQWLNKRFKQVTSDGIFFAHQNIYGFKSPYCEDGIILRYVIFINVIKALGMLRFESILDVGGAEGYMAAAFKKFFNVRVRSCDLSEEACKRAKEIFGVEADAVDGTSLPYENNSFDVVLSSESLEHIPQYEVVLKELLRVARKAVVITVPHDGQKAVMENIRNKVPHGHIHDFTRNAFRNLVPSSYGFRVWGLYSSLFKLPYRLIEGRAISLQSRTGIKNLLVRMINPWILFCGRYMNQLALKCLLKLDPFLADTLGTYRQLVFIIAKDPSSLQSNQAASLDIDTILDFKVPLHSLKERREAV